MLYREAGQYKTNYAADMAVFPILQDRIGMDIVKVWESLKPEHRIALRDLVHAIASR